MTRKTRPLFPAGLLLLGGSLLVAIVLTGHPWPQARAQSLAGSGGALAAAPLGRASGQVAAGADAAAIAIDAIPGGTVDPAVAAAVGAPVAVNLVITGAAGPYRAYQYELQWNLSVLAYDSGVSLMPDGLDVCQFPVVTESRVTGGCAAQAPTTYLGPVDTLSFRCLADGTSLLHLVTADEDPIFGTGLYAAPGQRASTVLTDAWVTCGAGGPVPTAPATPTATMGGPTPLPGGPTATPVPVPPGMESVEMVAGCNPVTSTYPDATPIGEIAAAVFPAGSLEAMWEFESGVWLGYSPQFPEVSDLTQKDFLDVLFVCVGAPSSFLRPLA